MRIFRSIILTSFFIAAGGAATAATLEQILTRMHVPDELISEILHKEDDVNQCLTTNEQLICVRGKKYPNISDNPVAKKAILQGIGISVRNDISKTLTSRIIPSTNLRNPHAVSDAFINAQNHGKFVLEDMQFKTFSRGNWCGAIASVPIANAKKQVAAIYTEPPFIVDYCHVLLTESLQYMARGENGEALERLKEIHDLKYANIEAYLLAIKAFILENQRTEAIAIAEEVLRDFQHKLSADEAEQLGDLFAELDSLDKAEACYKLGSSILLQE